MIKFTCDCCNITTEFVDAEEAYNKGWDAPPHFTTGYISCNLCPISFLYGVDHTPIHDKWAQEGRPDTFTEETCVVESERTGLTPEELAVNVNAMIESLVKKGYKI